MCKTYSVLSCKLATSFSNISILILLANREDHCEGYENCQYIEHEIILH